VCGEMACAETTHTFVSLLSIYLFLYFAHLLKLSSDGKVQCLLNLQALYAISGSHDSLYSRLRDCARHAWYVNEVSDWIMANLRTSN
jgi:hypothetical protein